MGVLLTATCVPFSIFLAELMLSLTFFLFCLHLVTSRRTLSMPPLFWMSLAFILWATATALLAPEHPRLWRSIFKNRYWLMTLPVVASLLRDPKQQGSLLAAFSIGGGIRALRILLENPVSVFCRPVRGIPADWFPRLMDLGSMTSGQSLMVGLLAALACLHVARVRGRRTAGWWCMLVVLTAGMLLNLKRGSWLCTLLMVTVFLAWRKSWRGLALLALAAVVFLTLPPVQERLRMLCLESDPRAGGRLSMWTQVAPTLIREHPLGVGYGALTNEQIRRAASPSASRNIEDKQIHLHSNPIQVLVETGWPGLVLYLIWMTWALYAGIRAVRRGSTPSERIYAAGLLVILLGLLLNGLVEYNFGDSELMILYGLTMGATAWAKPGSIGRQRC